MNHCVYVSIGLPHRHVCQQIVMNRLNGVSFSVCGTQNSRTLNAILIRPIFFFLDFISFGAQCEIAEKGKVLKCQHRFV